MPYRCTCLLLSLVLLNGCWDRDESPAGASTPAPVSAAHAVQSLSSETRRALIAQRLVKRPLSEALQSRLVEAWVVGSEGYDQAAMDRLLGAIDSSIEAVDQNRFNASKDLVLGHPAVAGSTIMGALINGLVVEGGGRIPIAVDCGGIRANGWFERSGARSNRSTVIITSLSVQEAAGKSVTYQHADGLAYLMESDGLEGLTLQPVTDQRGNSWLGLRAGTLVTLILNRTVDQSLLPKPALSEPSASASVAPATATAAAAADVTADKIPVSPALTPVVPTETFPADKATADRAANEPTPSNKVPVVAAPIAAPITPPPGK
jgi:hypothetical protein